MRLFLSDSFFDKFTDLARSVQQDVRDFQRKFRGNSQSAAIHLEPITQFKDSSLRTARVGRGYRAVLGALGNDNFVLLYVDKHDDAYRWAQNKKFKWNEHTQSCQIIPVASENPITEPGAEYQQTDVTQKAAPVAEAEPAIMDSISDEQLLNIGVPEELITLTRSIRDLDDLDRAESSLPQDAYENIFALLDGDSIDDIIAEIEAGKAKEGQDSLLSNNNKRRYIEITDDELLAKMMEEGTEKWQLFLHPSQSKLVDSNYRGTVKVSGSAGTGKTIAAIHRLKRLAQIEDSNILFTTYTKTLVQNISGLIDKMGIDKRRYQLNNIDKVLYEVVRENNILPLGFSLPDYENGEEKALSLWREVIDSELSEFEEEFLYSEYIDVIIYNNNKDLRDYLLQSRVGRAKALSRKQRAEIWKLKEKYEQLKKQRNIVDRLELFNIAATFLKEHDLHPYTHVICDEFQDFSNPELRFLRSLVKEGPNDLFLVGDPFQRVYNGRRINFGAAGINVRGKRSMKLKVNYRTTEEIKRMAVAVLKGERYDDLDGGEENNKGYVSLVHGEKPVYKIFGNSADEMKYVVEQIQTLAEANINLNDICVAAPSKSLYKEVVDDLHRQQYAYKEISGGRMNGSKDGVSFCTFHSLKGLEFRFVILVGVNERSMPSRVVENRKFAAMDAAERKEYLAHVRSLLYVAITRARQMVFISGCGEATGLLEPTE